jgi:hypothetical protein
MLRAESLYIEGISTLQIPSEQTESVRKITQSAMLGYDEAQYALGSIYRDGIGVPQSDKEAIRWLRKAAEQGHVEAQRHVGFLVKNTHTYHQNYFEAERWFKKAADKDDVEAMYQLALIMMVDKGFSPNHLEAKVYFSKAAESGHKAAEIHLSDVDKLTKRTEFEYMPFGTDLKTGLSPSRKTELPEASETTITDHEIQIEVNTQESNDYQQEHQEPISTTHEDNILEEAIMDNHLKPEINEDRITYCKSCNKKILIPPEQPPFGTVLSCSSCGESLVPITMEDHNIPHYYTPEHASIFLGYHNCSLEHPGCPFCGKTNYAVVFPDQGYKLGWYINRKPENPSSFVIYVKCVHCNETFVIEWDVYPFYSVVCNFCEAHIYGKNASMIIPESGRANFERDYGSPPALPSTIHNGQGEPIYIACGRCLEYALEVSKQVKKIEKKNDSSKLNKKVSGGTMIKNFYRKVSKGEIELKCYFCEAIFTIGVDSYIMTDEETYSKLVQSGVTVVFPSKTSLAPDLIAKSSQSGLERERVLKMARIIENSFKRGDTRLWVCGECKRRNTYTIESDKSDWIGNIFSRIFKKIEK